MSFKDIAEGYSILLNGGMGVVPCALLLFIYLLILIYIIATIKEVIIKIVNKMNTRKKMKDAFKMLLILSTEGSDEYLPIALAAADLKSKEFFDSISSLLNKQDILQDEINKRLVIDRIDKDIPKKESDEKSEED